MENQPLEGPNRRNVITGLAAAGVGVPLLAACGAATPSTPTAKPGTALTKTSSVPVGGGVILASANVVVTQPTSGEFKCFSATCTHQGCQLGSVSNGAIICPCHGSEFSILNGANTAGPNGSAPGSVAALSQEKITVADGEIRLT